MSDAEVFISQRKHNLLDLESIQKITENSPGSGGTASTYLIKVMTMELFERPVDPATLVRTISIEHNIGFTYLCMHYLQVANFNLYFFLTMHCWYMRRSPNLYIIEQTPST